MQVIKNERVSPFDVDSTLVIHSGNMAIERLQKDFPEQVLEVYDPISDSYLLVAINQGNLRLLKEELRRGAQVIVWSAGGWEWARNVLKALQLDKKNIIVMTKPDTYYDDKEVTEWLTRRVFIEPNETYKSVIKP